MLKYIDFIHTILINAGKKILACKNDYVIMRKEDGTPVTSADLEANDYIISELNQYFPNDIVFSEERIVLMDFTKRIWFLDPLDGTRNFIKGETSYSIMLSCVENGQVIIGAIYYPESQLLYYSERGNGVFKFGKDRLTKQLFLRNYPKSGKIIYKRSAKKNKRTRGILISLMDDCQTELIRPAGHACVQILNGKADGLIFGAGNIYEIGAVDILTTESGGIFLDIDGNPIDYTSGFFRIETGIIARRPDVKIS